MKEKVKIILRVAVALFFVLLFLGGFMTLHRLFSVHSPHGSDQARAFYYQPENSIDVVFMGSSHIHYDINTALLWENYGIAAYDYSTAEQPIWMTYHYMQELVKTQSPKVVVLDLFVPSEYQVDYLYDFIGENFYGMKPSANKLLAMIPMLEKDHIDTYFPEFFVTHSRYAELKDRDYELFEHPEMLVNFKGYTPYLETSEREQYYPAQDFAGGFTAKEEEYFIRIIKFAKEHDINLVIAISPFESTPNNELFFNRSREICEEYGIMYRNMTYEVEWMGVDWATDFFDESHLNYKGGCKYTTYLEQEILEQFDLPDHRGDPVYASWDEHVKCIDRFVNGETTELY